MLDRFRGEIYLILGALFFSFNGVISTLVLDHMSPFRLVQIRCIGAFTILFLFIVARNRNSLRATRQEIPTLILFGVIGFAVVQAGYFLGIQRGVPLSLVLIIEFTAPIWIVLWIKFVRKRDVPNAMWGGIALSFLGLFFIAKVWDGLIFDLIGIIGALISAFALAVYFLVGSQVGQTQSAQSMTAWGLGIATMAWTLVMPIWQFPFEIFSKSMNLQGVFDGTFLSGWGINRVDHRDGNNRSLPFCYRWAAKNGSIDCECGGDVRAGSCRSLCMDLACTKLGAYPIKWRCNCACWNLYCR